MLNADSSPFFAFNMACAGAQDQVANMRAKGVPAAQLCSTLTAAERGATLAALQANELRLLYVTPELLATGWRVLPACSDLYTLVPLPKLLATLWFQSYDP